MNFDKVNRHLLSLTILLGVGFFLIPIITTSVLGTKSQEVDRIRFLKEQYRLENEMLVSEINKEKSVAGSIEMQEKYHLVEKHVNYLIDSPDQVAMYE